MLEPGQFELNEAWLVFQLNEAPVSTEADGDFNVVCLMEAASLYILAIEFVPTQEPVADQVAVGLLEKGRFKGRTLPQQLLISSGLDFNSFKVHAKRLGIEFVLQPEDTLLPFTSEAKEGFKAHSGGDGVP
ncbi:hypothetical protein H8E52_07615 [bacterium]|nr:hypothetical protein [bacterium]